MNTLYYGDNLKILREYITNESVDLIYLDPPFNSNRNYNILFKDESGKEAEAQITAFEDTWHWSRQTEETYRELVDQSSPVGFMIGALRQTIGTNQMMAYLVMMAARLVELHRVLKPAGSLYLHCDPTASHYLKILLDAIYSEPHFRSDITWKRSSAHSDVKQGRRALGNVADHILCYTKGDDFTFNHQFTPYDEEYLRKTYNNVDPNGRRWKSSDLTGPGGAAKGNPFFEFMGVERHWRFTKENLEKLLAEGRIYQSRAGAVPRMKHYLDEMSGIPLQNIWDDIPPIGAQAAERLGYPTQKPLALLERIVNISSNPGDLVLDPFCGCGTTIAAAQKLGRRWIGIDITHLSIALQKYRLKDSFGLEEKKDYRVVGEPEDLGSARQLAQEDRYQFQWWALSLVKARPLGGEARQGKKGSDKGIDGVIAFIEDKSGKPQRVLVQVKSGKVKSGDIRDLRGTVEREDAAIGVFITLEESTRDMNREAAEAGFYRQPGFDRNYPKIQILTIADLLNGKQLEMPSSVTTTSVTFKQAQKVKKGSKQQGLGFE